MHILKLFLAIDLPEEIKAKLEKQVFPLKQMYPEFTWVPKENFHTTVYFFGDLEEDLVEKLSKKIEGALYDAPSFNLYSHNVDLFINDKILLYAGFQREKKLEELESKIATEFHAVHDYKYLPHLTLARYKLPSKQQYFHLKKRLEQVELDFEFPVTSISLFQSILKTKTPIYEKIAEFPLLTP